MTLPPCSYFKPQLFDSTLWPDHLAASAICAQCPMVTACIQRAVSIASEHSDGSTDSRGPDGTWGGLLWVDGSIVTHAYQLGRTAA